MARMPCNNFSILLLLTIWWLALEQVHSAQQEWGPVSKRRQSQGNVLICRTVHGWVEFCLDMNCEWAVKWQWWVSVFPTQAIQTCACLLNISCSHLITSLTILHFQAWQGWQRMPCNHVLLLQQVSLPCGHDVLCWHPGVSQLHHHPDWWLKSHLWEDRCQGLCTSSVNSDTLDLMSSKIWLSYSSFVVAAIALLLADLIRVSFLNCSP